MSYIRTKETIFKVVAETDLVYLVVAKNKKNQYAKSKCQTVVIKQADTIGELCDLVVYVPKGESKPNKSFPPLFNIAQINEINDALGHYYEYYDLDCFYYGIWTDKGLIYVAKMNEKGELELL